MRTYFIKGMVALAFAVSPFLFAQDAFGQIQGDTSSDTPPAEAPSTPSKDPYGLETAAGNAGIPKPAGAGTASSVNATIGYLIGQILTFVGVIFLILMVYGGLQWMIASKSGKEDDIAKAQKILYGAIIGMVIVFASYAVTAFVINVLTKAGTVAG